MLRTPYRAENDINGRHERRRLETDETKAWAGQDWGKLYAEWLSSNLSKNDFLRSKGIKYRGGAVSRNTRSWNDRLLKIWLRWQAQRIASVWFICLI